MGLYKALKTFLFGKLTISTIELKLLVDEMDANGNGEITLGELVDKVKAYVKDMTG